MDLVLCHTTADFDTLGAAVGISQLQPGTRIVLTGGSHPAVQAFLALHRDAYPLLDHRAVDPTQIRSLTLVDAQTRNRLGLAAPWVDAAIERGIAITIYDHHVAAPADAADQPSTRAAPPADIPQAILHLEAVGAVTTVIAEALQAQGKTVSPAVATVMALGIHVDTGSLRYAQAQPRDAAALAWLMAQGADQDIIAEATETTLSEPLRQLLSLALTDSQIEQKEGYRLGWLCLQLDEFVPGLSSLTRLLMSILSVDALLLGALHPTKSGHCKLTLIGRARTPLYQQAHPQTTNPALTSGMTGPDFAQILSTVGGGGHPQAAAASITAKTDTPKTELRATFDQVLTQLRQQVPKAATIGTIMSTPVRTVWPTTTISQAQRVLLRYGHAGLCVVTDTAQLVGLISRRDIDLALHHGFGHAPVKGYMTRQVQTISPQTPIVTVRSLMITHDIGRLPVLEDGTLVGIVTRSDLLRQVHTDYMQQPQSNVSIATGPALPTAPQLTSRLQEGLSASLWSALMQIATAADQQGWQVYLVGGAVRDLLLTPAGQSLSLKDIDLVVDGGHRSPAAGAGVALAEVIQQQDPTVNIQVHGKFQTAALTWPKGTALGPLMIDIATARTEFYAYPAANPEVEASSIRQDLYRRDFTINAMAIRLTPPQGGQLLDFFGGWLDLQQRIIRVLHPNSFIEDPTRIFRAVRFATRLGFRLEAQTQEYIHYAIASGIYTDLQRSGLPHRRLPALQTRLRAELKLLLSAPQWRAALDLLQTLGALSCIHPDLHLTPAIGQQLNRLNRWIQRFGTATPARWQLLLEALLADLGAAAAEVATALDLPTDSQQRLLQLPETEGHLNRILPTCQRPSDIDHVLRPLPTPLLWLIALRHARTLGPPIWHYLLHLQAIPSPLNGHDLRRLGYAPGPHFKAMLANLRAATLDGQVNDRDTALSYIAQHYPRLNP
ncbi:MAG: CBS domain-containing protein [Cyanobacteria bacterium J06632_22]